MKYALALPEDFREIADFDLQKNKKQMLIVNGISLVIALALIVPMIFVVPINTLFAGLADMNVGLQMLIKMAALLGFMLVYMVLHELVHGICMRAIAGIKPRYGFTGMYAYAASDAYFGKGPYILIALAPVVLWGIVLAIVTPLVPVTWFWVVYFIQIMNLSGAAGDIYVTCCLLRMPKDVLIRDWGVAMKVYAKQD